MKVPKWVQEHAKTIAAFVVTFALNSVVSLIDGTTPWPQNRDQWVQYLLTSVGAAIAAYKVRNKITQKQLDADPNVLGGIVVDQKVVDQKETPTVSPSVAYGPSTGPYVNPFPDPTNPS